MGFLIASSNNESALFSGCNITLIPDTLIEVFYQILVQGGFHRMVVTLSPAYRERLLEINQDYFPEDASDIPNNAIIQTILENREIEKALATHRRSDSLDGIVSYNRYAAEKILSPISDVLYALQLAGIFVSLELANRLDLGNFTSPNPECLMFLNTCNMLKQFHYGENDITQLLDRFIVVYQNALKTPDGFVTYG